MTASLSITKMHGACNDFVVVDCRTNAIASLPAFARWACNRHAGIGADGVIAIEASNGSRIAMRAINADGSEAEMCGNGARCAARWLDEAGVGERIEFDTAAGPVRTQVIARQPEYLVRVTVGTPHLETFARHGETGYRVELGNPHVVFFRERVDDAGLERLARSLQGDPELPHGANVHLAAIEGPSTLRVRHWERGVGPTLACGTGATACAAAAISSGRAVSPVEVLVPGGRLLIEWDGRAAATLTGPAVRVFDAKVTLPAAAAV